MVEVLDYSSVYNFKCGYCEELCETSHLHDEFTCPNCKETMIPNDELQFCSHCGDEINGDDYIQCEDCGLRFHSSSDYCAGWTDIGDTIDSQNWEKDGLDINEWAYRKDNPFKNSGQIVCDTCMKEKGSL